MSKYCKRGYFRWGKFCDCVIKILVTFVNVVVVLANQTCARHFDSLVQIIPKALHSD